MKNDTAATGLAAVAAFLFVRPLIRRLRRHLLPQGEKEHACDTPPHIHPQAAATKLAAGEAQNP